MSSIDPLAAYRDEYVAGLQTTAVEMQVTPIREYRGGSLPQPAERFSRGRLMLLPSAFLGAGQRSAAAHGAFRNAIISRLGSSGASGETWSVRNALAVIAANTGAAT